jgi:hypothetical protein
MGLVSEVLAHGGFLPQLAELNSQKKSIYTKKNGVVFSVFWFIFFVPLLTSIFGGVFDIEVLGEICALIGVFGSLMLLIASLVFLPSSKPKFKPLPPQMMNAPVPAAGLYGAQQHQQSVLPPQQTMPASAYTAPRPGKWRETNELQPTSVIEETTRLLNRDDK